MDEFDQDNLDEVAKQSQLVAWVTPKGNIGTAYLFPGHNWTIQYIEATALTTRGSLTGVAGLLQKGRNLSVTSPVDIHVRLLRMDDAFRYTLFWIDENRAIVTVSAINIVQQFFDHIELIANTQFSALLWTEPQNIHANCELRARSGSTLTAASRAPGTLELYWDNRGTDDVCVWAIRNRDGMNFESIKAGYRTVTRGSCLHSPARMTAVSPNHGEMQLIGFVDSGEVAVGEVLEGMSIYSVDWVDV